MFSFNIFVPNIYKEYFDNVSHEESSSCLLFGFKDRSRDGRTMNIHVTSILCESQLTDANDRKLQNLISRLPANNGDSDEDEFIFLGECHNFQDDCDNELYDSFQLRTVFCYDPAEKELRLKSFVFNHINIGDLSACSVIIYDIESFMSSQLLLEGCQSNDA